MRIAIVSMWHETNSFALERNDTIDFPIQVGQEMLDKAHPRDYIGGFVEAIAGPEVVLVPIAKVDFVTANRGGTITANVFKYYLDFLIKGLQHAQPLDGVYFALHGAMAVEEPYLEAEAVLIKQARQLLGEAIPFVGTYDFHSNYTDWECSALVPFPLNTNPHIDAYERGKEAAACLLKMLAGNIKPITRRIHVPIIGPNIGQSSWAHNPLEEQRLPMYQLNLLRAEMEKMPGVINVTLQGGYGYSDLPYTGMSVIVTTDDDDALLADNLAKQLARALWARREEIRTVRPILPLDEGIKKAMAYEDGLSCLVDIGDDPGSLCPADSPVVLEALIRLGAQDCALTLRDPDVVRAGLKAGIGATLTMAVGAKIDQRFYQPVQVTGYVKHIDDGRYKIVGPSHGGWSKEVTKESFKDADVGPRVVLRIANKIDAIFTDDPDVYFNGKDRDFFKSAGIVLEEKRIVVVKSNQAHRASFDPIVDATIELDTPGVGTATYSRLPFQHIPRPIYPLDLTMEWEP
jgi:microcystin degradation protein MlrC